MRDYLYIPLGGNRVHSNVRLYTNLVVVFAISGLWHGASWNFLVWGLYHGIFLILDRIFLRQMLGHLPKWISRIFTFSWVLVGWVFFAIEDFNMALEFLGRIAHPGLLSLSAWSVELGLLSVKSIFVLSASLLFTTTAIYDRFKLDDSRPVLMACVGISLWLVSVSYLAGSDFNPFIYFRF